MLDQSHHENKGCQSIYPRFGDAPGHGNNLFIRLNGSIIKQYFMNKFWVYSLQFFPLAFCSSKAQNWIITTLHLVGGGCSGHHQWRQWKHREQVLAPWLTKRVSFYTLPVLVPVCFKFSF